MVDELIFTAAEATKVKEITKYYELTKELLIFGEQVDPQSRTLAQTINELRNCLDHMMRVTAFKFGLRKAENEQDYVSVNLDKAYGHVYRAAYDTLDWISLTLRGRISDELQNFSLETIQAALPDYFTVIKPRIEHLLGNEVTKLRMEKDIAAKSEKNLVAYTKVTAEFKDLFQKIIDALPALVEHRGRLKQAQRRQLTLRVVENVVVGLIVGILVWLFT